MGWCVGPSSPRPMESCVYTWITRWLHQRRHAHGIARVVGEHQERAAVGTEAAVQRHAVHDRGHAELAHAVVDVVAGGIVGRDGLRVLAEGVVRAGEVRRAAEQFGQRRARWHSARPARTGAWPAAPSRPAPRRSAACAMASQSAGSSPLMRRCEFARQLRDAPAHSARRALCPLLLRGRCRAARRSQASRMRLRESRTAARVQPSFARAAATSSAPSASPCVDLVPSLFGAPQPMMVLQQISVGRSRVCHAPLRSPRRPPRHRGRPRSRITCQP